MACTARLAAAGGCGGVPVEVSRQHRYEWEYLYGALEVVAGQSCFAFLPKVGLELTPRFLSQLAATAPAYSNFDIAAYLTEIILLGCIALRVGEGRPMQWDGPNMKSPNLPEAEQFVSRKNRAGWEA